MYRIYGSSVRAGSPICIHQPDQSVNAEPGSDSKFDTDLCLQQLQHDFTMLGPGVYYVEYCRNVRWANKESIMGVAVQNGALSGQHNVGGVGYVQQYTAPNPTDQFKEMLALMGMFQQAMAGIGGGDNGRVRELEERLRKYELAIEKQKWKEKHTWTPETVTSLVTEIGGYLSSGEPAQKQLNQASIAGMEDIELTRQTVNQRMGRAVATLVQTLGGPGDDTVPGEGEIRLLKVLEHAAAMSGFELGAALAKLGIDLD